MLLNRNRLNCISKCIPSHNHTFQATAEIAFLRRNLKVAVNDGDSKENTCKVDN